ncbi:hypothetical protein PU560_03880 [Georgenia sp. 10Sc9-8]|uniref:Holin-like toxin n=1 Tax=Georgenia halotolerans TaxID=3028317 RepID=A0ABT5TU88_9MICO|nr:hypothetical protein [Georgenia halotolerans]
MKSSLVTFAAEESEAAEHALPMAAEMYGVIALVALMTLLLITLAFRSAYTRH